MKVVLQYTNVIHDTTTVFNTFASNNIEILKIKSGIPRPKVTIRVKDNNELIHLMYVLNTKCVYEVEVIKIKSENSIFGLIKRLFLSDKEN